MEPPLFHRTLKEQLTDHLRNDILSGRYSESERLRETELANRYQLSRGPIRDAFLQLTNEGLLVAKPNCGVAVASPPSEPVRALTVKLRRAIEGHAVGVLCGRLSKNGLDTLRQVLKEYRAACRKGDMPTVVRLDMAFHQALIELAGEPDLLAMWRPITVRLRLPYNRHTNLEESADEHDAIVHALEAGNRRKALLALRTNIQ